MWFFTVWLYYRTLQQSGLFSKHPHLFRLTGVHLTVMNVIKSYLSFNSNLKGKSDFVKVRVQRKRKMAISKVSDHLLVHE